VLTDRDLERYSRQLMLPDFSIDAQERLAVATVLVVGVGGLGCPLALYLAGAGVGRLILADGDTVERSNLARQPLYGEADIGRPKAEVAAARLGERFPDVTVDALAEHLAEPALAAHLDGVDLVADGSDNYPIRFALNRACIAARLPLVSAAAVRGEGQLVSFAVHRGTPCYRCLYPDTSPATALSCRDSGVLGPVVGTLGTLQALEVIKLLSGWGEPLLGRLLYLDLASPAQRIVTLAQRSDCPDCAGRR
jgi:adenylyltransferase/sulfurtransferase